MTTTGSKSTPTEEATALAAMKQAVRQTWAMGDFAAIAERELWPVGERIVKRLAVRPDEAVLDIACGTGNAAIRAALAGASTIGVDLTPELLATAQQLAARAGVTVNWREGDAEALPVDDATIDVVVSTFGCELAPRHRAVAREIARVLSPGGRLGLCVWPPDGTMGAIMQTVARYLRRPLLAPNSRCGGASLPTSASCLRGPASRSASSEPSSNTSRSHRPKPTSTGTPPASALDPCPRNGRGRRTMGRDARRAHHTAPRPNRARILRHPGRQERRDAIVTGHVYDAIIVGARCAGAPTAMLLARKGYEVLAVDRAHFPSDTVSTHLIHAPGVAALRRWGLLDQLIATGCPPITTYSFDFGPVRIIGNPASGDRTGVAYCPRRTVLDALLLDAAHQAGAEIREGFNFEELVFEDGAVAGVRGSNRGATVAERARIVIGADGSHSRVARAVGAHAYRDKSMLSVGYYSYWRGMPITAAEWVVRPGNGFGAFPTNDDLTLLLAAWPHAQLGNVKGDIEGNYHHAITSVFGERVAGARREERIVGGGVPDHFRVPFGLGWALVGDAGYLRDPVTAQGITDAFRDAELCTAAVDDAFSGARPFARAMAAYQHQRDGRVDGIYEFTAQLATLEPPPPELQHLLRSIDGNTDAMNEFTGLIAGTVTPAEFFAPNHLEALVTDGRS